MVTQLHQQSDSLDDRDARLAALEHRDRVLSDRLERLEHIHGIGVDDVGAGWLKVKQAAPASGYSESAIYKMIRQSRVAQQWRGGNVYVTEVPTRRR
jgi:hypothetical protein